MNHGNLPASASRVATVARRDVGDERAVVRAARAMTRALELPEDAVRDVLAITRTGRCGRRCRLRLQKINPQKARGFGQVRRSEKLHWWTRHPYWQAAAGRFPQRARARRPLGRSLQEDARVRLVAGAVAEVEHLHSDLDLLRVRLFLNAPDRLVPLPLPLREL
jgi:hypothetical protein